MADNTTELEVLDEIVDVLGGQSGQYETVVPVLQQIYTLLEAGITDPEVIAAAVAAWLNEHPEATTTVQDGSITGPKIADDTIPDAKLAQTGGVLSKVAALANSQLDFVFGGDFSGTRILQVACDLPAGTYLLHVKSVTTDDTDSDLSCISFYGNSSMIKGVKFARDQPYEAKLTLARDCANIYFYSGQNAAESGAGETFTYHGVVIYRTTVLSERLDSLESFDTALGQDLYKYDSAIYDDAELLRGRFERGSLSSGNFVSSYKYRVATPDTMTYPKSLNLTIKSGYRLGIQTFVNGSFSADSGWRTGTYHIPANTVFKAVISKVTEDTSSTADIDEFMSAVTVETLDGKVASIDRRLSVLENPFRLKPYFSHLGISSIASQIVVPCQSIFDVRRAKRLGFDVLELNVHKLSDGNYLCYHGSGGNFDYQVTDLNGDAVSGTVASKTLTWVKANVRYVSRYARYRVAPFSLQEMLTECMMCKVIPLVQYVDDAEVAILDEYMGRGNYILNVYGNTRGNKTDAPIGSWLKLPDVADVLAKAEESGLSYSCGINASDTTFDDFTLSDWQNYVQEIHAAGFTANFTYVSPEKAATLWLAGFDGCGARWEINDLDSGNLLDLDGGADFSEFDTSGSVADSVLSLTTGQTISLDMTNVSPVFLGGISMHIRFSGELQISLGRVYGRVFASDGMHDTWVSSFIEDEKPNLLITATANTEVYEITYKASKL